MPELPVLIYLHGFNSSPNAMKAQQVEYFLQNYTTTYEYHRPWIPDLPEQAVAMLDAFLQQFTGRRVFLIGSSLGGYYATWLAERYACKAALVNPSIRPYELLHQHLGEQRNPYSGQRYTLTTAHMQTLKSLFLQRIMHPSRYLVLLQMADEVLNAVEASQRFYQSRCMIEPGGNHQFQEFQRYLPAIFAWFEAE